MDLASRFIYRAKSDGIVNSTKHVYDYLPITIALFEPLFYLRLFQSFKFLDIRVYLSCDMRTNLNRSTDLPHPVGIVIGKEAKIGKNVCIYQNIVFS